MKKQIICLSIILIAGLGVSAQTTDKTVESIRVRYTEIAEKARLCETDDEQGEYGSIFMNTLTINSRNHQWRAVGIYGQTYKFFYKGGDTEAHLYPDQLVFVVNEKKISDHNYREEYLFSDTGALLFYFYTSDFKLSDRDEIRVYFSGQKPIRVAKDQKTHDRMTKADLITIKRLIAVSDTLKQIFKQSIAL